jgi:2-phosphoglycerate kinase
MQQWGIDQGLAAVVAALIGAVAALVPVSLKQRRARRVGSSAQLQRLGEVHLLVNGANSVGKSTLAFELSRRYHIEAIIGTDSLREILRSVPEVVQKHPEITVSSFEAHQALAAKRGTPASVEEGIEAQCVALWPAIKGVLRHSRDKRKTAVLEGADLLASQVFGSTGLARAAADRMLFVNLYIGDEKLHRKRLHERGKHVGMRRTEYEEKYENSFAEITRVQEFLRKDTQQACKDYPEAHILSLANDGSLEEAVRKVGEELERFT